MGNRAVITDEGRNIAVYLHWNGGRDSVEGFLEYCKRKGCRGFGDDTPYAAARLTQVVANFMGGTLSVGVMPKAYAGEDNGLYIVKGWDIVGRKYEKYDEKSGGYKEVNFPKSWEQHEYKLEDMLEAIDENQPERDKLGDLCRARLVSVSSLKAGDKIWQAGDKEPYEILGFGEDKVVNGHNVKGLARLNRYGDGDETNPNNYVYDESVYIL